MSDDAPSPQTATATGSAVPQTQGSAAGLRPAVSSQVRDAKRYAILGEHGRGGLGRVSRARDVDLGRDVAIKELISRGLIGELRFMREALITARLEHPGIVPVYEAGCWDDGTPFYAMKLVSGQPLHVLLAERTTVDDRLGLLPHVVAVADAMAYAHRRGVIHRDLKPSNVIVGEFGETVVIDWGLAKDISQPDEAGDGQADAQVDGQVIAGGSPELTEAGSVLGTPLYMSPEQTRGEAVDQRTDVFAIGAMLWQLCALERDTPRDLRVRHRVLRRNGIDRDLIAILDKALADAPGARYADASGLASDLRSFQSGTRIAARRYSFVALLAHWARRHRALAAAMATIAVLALGGGALYIRNVTAARDRVEAANDELVLGQAELLLRTSDPTAAAARLSSYHGSDLPRRDRMLAEARGRGIARQAFEPHVGGVPLIVGTATGELFSLGGDHKLLWHHGGRTDVLATDAAASISDYAVPTHRVAYATSPSGIAVVELATHAIQRLDAERTLVIAFDVSGTRLAAIDVQSVVTVWALGPRPSVIYRKQIPGARWTWFGAGTQLVAASEAAIWTVDVATPGAALRTFDVAPSNANAQLDRLVVADRRGLIEVFDRDFAPRGQLAVCKGQVTSAIWAGTTDLIMFGCEEGGAGLARWDAAHDTLTRTESFPTRPVPVLNTDSTGRYISIADQSSDVAIYDRDTHVMRACEGLPGRSTTVAFSEQAQPRVLAGDAYGHIWIWDVPSGPSRQVVAPSELPETIGMGFVDDATLLELDYTRLKLRAIAGDVERIIELGLHAALSHAVSPDRRSFAAWGLDDGFVIAQLGDAPSVRYATGAPVDQVVYVDPAHVLSSGGDGRLLAWTLGNPTPRELFHAAKPDGGALALTDLVLAPGDHAVITDQSGALYDVAPSGAARTVLAGGGAPRPIRLSTDGRMLGVALGDAIALYDTRTWQETRRIPLAGNVRELQIAPDGRSLLVLQPDRHVRLFSLDDTPPPWTDLVLGAITSAYSPDGATIALGCSYGVEWLYSLRDHRWVYVHDHGVDLTTEHFSPDGRSLVGMDLKRGSVLHDVPGLFAQAALPERAGPR